VRASAVSGSTSSRDSMRWRTSTPCTPQPPAPWDTTDAMAAPLGEGSGEDQDRVSSVTSAATA
jgi:hypothetical protein